MANTAVRWIVAITGASGGVYGRRLLEALVCADLDVSVDLVISEAGLRVLREEEGIRTSAGSVKLKDLLGMESERVCVHNVRDIGASIASGSAKTAGMVVVPCSMATLGAIANGTGQNLVHRAADVVLKESRKLILVPRETPLSAVHLENMLKLSRMGVVIAPAMPGFYHQPGSIDELVDMMVMRILDQMNIDSDLAPRWREGEAKTAWRGGVG